MPGFQSFFRNFLHNFVKAKLAISSIRVKVLDLYGPSHNFKPLSHGGYDNATFGHLWICFF